MSSIPVIDLGAADAERRPKTARRVGAALREVGFFAVENHGVPSELLDAAYAAALAFFDLPTAEKERSVWPGSFGQRGYTGFAVERAIGAGAPDLKEFFQIGRATGTDAYGSNVWPSTPPAFREVFSDLFARLEALANRVAAACSLDLGRDADFLPSMLAGGETVLRVIHYPPLASAPPAGAVRAAAHTDINFLTLLCGATAAGLEIQDRDGLWHAVQAARSQIVVDAGDMLQNLTGGRFRSTTHRVVNPAGSNERRLSLPFFVHPRADVDLTPLPDLGHVWSDRTFPSVSAGEFLRERLAAIRPGEK